MLNIFEKERPIFIRDIGLPSRKASNKPAKQKSSKTAILAFQQATYVIRNQTEDACRNLKKWSSVSFANFKIIPANNQVNL
jgi:hypothetical protein